MKAPQMHALIGNTVGSIKGADAFKDGSTDDVAGIKYNIADRVITLELTKIDPNILTTFTQFAILPKHLLGDVDPLKFQQSDFWQKPIGSGAFKITEVKMNDFAKSFILTSVILNAPDPIGFCQKSLCWNFKGSTSPNKCLGKIAN